MIWRKREHERCCKQPRPAYDVELQDWSHRPQASSPEVEIVDHLEKLGSRDRRILHVGVGNSYVARCFGARAQYIDGVTINPLEKQAADDLRLGRYHVHVGDKHVWSTYEGCGRLYDWIIEPALTSYACCKWHLVNLLEVLTALLADGGTLWSHTKPLGIRWETQYGLGDPPVPPMAAEELECIERDQPVRIERIGAVVAIRLEGSRA